MAKKTKVSARKSSPSARKPRSASKTTSAKSVKPAKVVKGAKKASASVSVAAASKSRSGPKPPAKPTEKSTPPAPPKPIVRMKPTFVPPPPSPRDEDRPALTEAQLRKINSGLSKQDLTHYRELLLQKRAEIIGDVESLKVDTKNNGGNLSHMPVHMADVGSDNFDQEFTLGLVESEQKMLREINEALGRMEKGYYGVCVEKGVPIGKPRLDAKPWAKYCIEVVREMERRGLI